MKWSFAIIFVAVVALLCSCSAKIVSKNYYTEHEQELLKI